jgi:hypothetical protein
MPNLIDKVRRFNARTAADKRLLVQCALLLIVVRAALLCCSFPRVQKILERWGQERPLHGRVSPEAVSWAVETAARHLIGSDCLTRALVTQLVLARNGHAAHVHIDMSRDEGGKLVAHARLEPGAAQPLDVPAIGRGDAALKL